MVDQLPNGCPQQPDRLVLDTPPLALRDRGQNGPHVAGRFGPLIRPHKPRQPVKSSHRRR